MTCSNSARGPRTSVRRPVARWAQLGLVLAVLSGFIAVEAQADPFIFNGNPIHPGCVHALAMSTGDAIPVTTAISLEGCMASARSKPEVQTEGEANSISDADFLDGGSFAYRELGSLDNGLTILGIRRTDKNGEEKVSFAAVDLVDRPALRGREVVQRKWLEMIGEVWIKDMRTANVRTVGNVVSFSAGLGNSRVDETIDLSRIGRARNKKK